MKRKIYPYNPKLKPLAQKLRNNMTLSEVILWEHLKGKQMEGIDFHRQKPLGNYIVDFFCNELGLAIEIDGESHLFKPDEDAEREKDIERLGVQFLRFDDKDVKQDLDAVLNHIRNWILENS